MAARSPRRTATSWKKARKGRSARTGPRFRHRC
jgi:hypothetical protein